mmetsp:Transcript_6010/g.12884  ORF Transcript_6010/g.12884 Transcript_6010/m.12884 type:complete len:267 (-) Transcript_6010:30-830(-)
MGRVVFEEAHRMRAERRRVRHHLRKEGGDQGKQLRAETAVEPLQGGGEVLDPVASQFVFSAPVFVGGEALLFGPGHDGGGLRGVEEGGGRHLDQIQGKPKIRGKVLRRHGSHGIRPDSVLRLPVDAAAAARFVAAVAVRTIKKLTALKTVRLVLLPVRFQLRGELRTQFFHQFRQTGGGARPVQHLRVAPRLGAPGRPAARREDGAEPTGEGGVERGEGVHFGVKGVVAVAIEGVQRILAPLPQSHAVAVVDADAGAKKEEDERTY